MNKAFIGRLKNSNVFWACVSLLLAVLLWTYVTGTEGVAEEKVFTDVKVEFLGEEALRESSGLVVTDQSTAAVNLRLSGMRRNLAKLSSSNLRALVDLSDIRTDGHYTKLYTVEYPSGFSADDVVLLSGNTRSVSITVDRLVTRTVEVKGSFTGSTADGFLAQSTLTFDPLAVKLTGPKSEVEKVDHAWVTISRENVDASISYSTTYVLRDAEGNELDLPSVTAENEEVNVTLSVLMTKTVPLTVARIPGGGAVETDSSVSVTPESIILAGDPETLSAVNQIIVDTVKLANVDGVYEAEGLPIVLPNDTVSISGEVTADVRVEVQGLGTESFRIDAADISCTNVAEGYEVEIITSSLDVLVRTNENDIPAIEAKNIRVSADLSSVVPNDSVVDIPVRISIDGFPNAGAVGEYKIYVILRSVGKKG